MIPHDTRDWLDHVSYETSTRRRLNRDAVKEHLINMEQVYPLNLPILDELMTRIVSLKHFDIQGVGGWSSTAPGFHIQQQPPHEKVYVVLAVIPLKSLEGIRVRLQKRIPNCIDTSQRLLRFQAEIKDDEGIESVIRYLRKFI